MFGRLIRWTVTTLFVIVTGAVIGCTISIIIAVVPLWAGVVALMVVSIALFKFAVWCIENGGW